MKELKLDFAEDNGREGIRQKLEKFLGENSDDMHRATVTFYEKGKGGGSAMHHGWNLDKHMNSDLFAQFLADLIFGYVAGKDNRLYRGAIVEIPRREEGR